MPPPKVGLRIKILKPTEPIISGSNPSTKTLKKTSVYVHITIKVFEKHCGMMGPFGIENWENKQRRGVAELVAEIET